MEGERCGERRWVNGPGKNLQLCGTLPTHSNIGMARKRRLVAAPAAALNFLVHFYGDLHQPLHLAGRARDGNGINVRFDRRHTSESVVLK